MVTEADGSLRVNHDPLPNGWIEKIHFDMKPTNSKSDLTVTSSASGEC